jgi:hypothetical protein
MFIQSAVPNEPTADEMAKAKMLRSKARKFLIRLIVANGSTEGPDSLHVASK